MLIIIFYGDNLFNSPSYIFIVPYDNDETHDFKSIDSQYTTNSFHEIIILYTDEKNWFTGLFFQGIRSGSKFLHCVTRQNRFMVGSILKFQNKMVVMRLLWALQNIPGKKTKGFHEKSQSR